MTRTLARLTALLLVPLAMLHAADAPAKRPNIVVIMADDLGWRDLPTAWRTSSTPGSEKAMPDYLSKR